MLDFYVGFMFRLEVVYAYAAFLLHDRLEHYCQVNTAIRSWTSCFFI